MHIHIYSTKSATHVEKARKIGIGDDEIDEAIAVGRMIQKGALSAMDRFAASIIVGPEKNLPHVATMMRAIAAANAGKRASP